MADCPEGYQRDYDYVSGCAEAYYSTQRQVPEDGDWPVGWGEFTLFSSL